MNNNKEASKKEIIAYLTKIYDENKYLREELDKDIKDRAINFTGSSLELPSKELIDLEARRYSCKLNDINHYNLTQKRAFEQGAEFVKMYLQLKN